MCVSHSVVPTPCDPMDCSPPGSSVHGVGSHFLLQGIFSTQGLNPDILHCRQILYHLSHQGSLLASINTVLLDPIHIRSFTYASNCSALKEQLNTCNKRPYDLQSLKYLLSAFHRKSWLIPDHNPSHTTTTATTNITTSDVDTTITINSNDTPPHTTLWFRGMEATCAVKEFLQRAVSEDTDSSKSLPPHQWVTETTVLQVNILVP